MTIFGVDTSHYDGVITPARAKAMYVDGIRFASHKLTQGTNYTDPTCRDSMTAFRDAGVPVLSTYHWLVPGSDRFVVDQAHFWLNRLDAVVPWWRDFGPMFLQADCEIQSGGGKPTPHQVKLFCDEVTTASPLLVVVYASAGMYGDTLAGLGHPLWNAHYGGNPAAGLDAAYAAQGGDTSAGWHPYSGQKPVLLQFGSRVTIGGLGTCDADAYLGTVNQLVDFVTSNGSGEVPVATPVDLTPAAITAIGAADDVKNWRADAATNPTMQRKSALYYGPVDVLAAVASLSAKVDALAEQLLGKPPTTVAGDFDVTGTLHLSTPPA